MPELLLAVIDGAWDDSTVSTLTDSLGSKWNDLRPYFAVDGRPVQEIYRGADTDPEVLDRWKQAFVVVEQCPGVALIPAAFAECEVTKPLLEKMATYTPALLVTTTVSDTWRRLQLNVPGLPAGLGPIRATWIRMQQQRVAAWKSLGAEIIDTSHCDASEQAKTLENKIHAKINLS